MGVVIIRTAAAGDAAAICGIYAPYVRNTAITFEYEPPDEAEQRARMTRITAKYPYLVAELDGEVAGYAYAGQLKDRPAYSWAAETSIYVRWDMKRRGIGSALYGELENRLRRQGILNLYACIASPPVEDEYLTRDSSRFHMSQGFNTVGEFHACGYKFGRWYDMVWMEKSIGEHLNKQPPVKWRLHAEE